MEPLKPNGRVMVRADLKRRYRAWKAYLTWLYQQVTHGEEFIDSIPIWQEIESVKSEIKVMSYLEPKTQTNVTIHTSGIENKTTTVGTT